MCMKCCQTRILTLALMFRDFIEASLGRHGWLLPTSLTSVSSPSPCRSSWFNAAQTPNSLFTWLAFLEWRVPTVGHLFSRNYQLGSEEPPASHHVSINYQCGLRSPPKVTSTFHSLGKFQRFKSYLPGDLRDRTKARQTSLGKVNSSLHICLMVLLFFLTDAGFL